MLNTLINGFYKHLPDTLYHQVKFVLFFKKIPRLDKPAAFSEKILRRKIYPHSIYTLLSNKLKVREFIAALLGDQYLVELYAHGNEFSYGIFNKLPQSFVLKANHGRGYSKQVFDKTQVSYTELYGLSCAWLRSNVYEQNRERYYQGIEPCLMVERLPLEQGKVPNSIKFHCFNRDGEIRLFIQVDSQHDGSRRSDIFDTRWNRTEIRLGLPNASIPAERPTRLGEMILLATKVAHLFPYVRVAFYQLAERVYFDELTFTPGAGLMRLQPKTIEQEWGSYFVE